MAETEMKEAHFVPRSFLGQDRVPDLSAYMEGQPRTPLAELLKDDTPVSSADDYISRPSILFGKEERKVTFKDRLRDMCCPVEGVSKFSWWDGVAIRDILNIWSGLMFLRIPYLVGQAGVLMAVGLMVLCTAATMLTTVAISALATNGLVKGSGVYFLTSRSLGPEFGNVIGVLLTLTNAIDIAQYTVATGETVVTAYATVAENATAIANATMEAVESSGFHLVDGEVWDVRIWGCITLVVCLIITFFGANLEVKIQLGLMVVMVVSIGSVFIGSFRSSVDPTDGFVGYSVENFNANLWPDFKPGPNGEEMGFWPLVGIFFPAVTGIMAGVNMSNDLKDPATDIPKGEFTSVTVTSGVYVLLVIVAGGCCSRAALLSNYFVFNFVTLWAPLIMIGIIACSTSSVFSNLLGTPRIIQGMGRDGIVKGLSYLAKGYGHSDEPLRARVPVFLLAAACTLIGELNVVSNLITNVSLLTYGLVNFSCFAVSMARSPGWRPTLRFYHPLLALLGAVLCLFMMIMTDWFSSVISLALAAVIFLVTYFKTPNINWGSAGQALRYMRASTDLYHLTIMGDHIKNWRPSFLVLTGQPAYQRQSLLNFSRFFSKGRGITVCGNVVVCPDDSQAAPDLLAAHKARGTRYLRHNKIKAFMSVVLAERMRAGVYNLMQICGLGKLEPNTLMMGFKKNWNVCSEDELDQYVGIIRDAFRLQMGVVVVAGEGWPLMHRVHYSWKYMVQRALCCQRNQDDEDKDDNDFSGTLPLRDAATDDWSARHTTTTNAATAPPTSPQLRLEGPDSAAAAAAAAITPVAPIRGTGEARARLGDLFNAPTAESDAPRPSVELTVTSPGSYSVATPMRAMRIGRARTAGSFVRAPAPGSRATGEYSELTEVVAEEPPTHDELPEAHPHDRITVDNAAQHISAETVSTTTGGHLAAAARSLARQAPHQPTAEKIRRPTGFIDVYWIADDGGLTMLLPHLLHKHAHWRKCRLRLFVIGTTPSEHAMQQRLEELIKMFRLDAAPKYIDAGPDGPRPETVARFEALVGHPIISEFRERTHRFLRWREIMEEQSTQAELIFCSLYVPTYQVPSRVYLSWLAALTDEMPPVILLRGNQHDVLTVAQQ